jgi:hypothetical protein
LSGLEVGPLLGQLRRDQGVQGGDPVEPLGQAPACQHAALIVDDLDVVVVFGPVIPNEQHCFSFPLRPVLVSSTEEAAGDLMVECSPRWGHDIPVAVSPPHDQRAHGLPQDLNGPIR